MNIQKNHMKSFFTGICLAVALSCIPTPTSCWSIASAPRYAMKPAKYALHMLSGLYRHTTQKFIAPVKTGIQQFVRRRAPYIAGISMAAAGVSLLALWAQNKFFDGIVRERHGLALQLGGTHAEIGRLRVAQAAHEEQLVQEREQAAAADAERARELEEQLAQARREAAAVPAERVHALEAELAEIRERNTAEQAERARELEEQLAEIREQAAAAQAERATDLGQQLAQAQRDAATAQALHEQQAAETLRGSIRLQATHSRNLTKLDAIQAERDQQIARVDALGQELATLQRLLAETHVEHAHQLGLAHTQVNAKQGAAVQAKAERSAARIRALEETARQLKEQLAELNAQFEHERKQAFTERSEEMRVLEEKLTQAHKEEVARLKIAQTELQQQIKHAQGQIEALEQERGNAVENRNAVEALLKTEQAKGEGNAARIRALEERECQLNAHIEELDARIRDIGNEHATNMESLRTQHGQERERLEQAVRDAATNLEQQRDRFENHIQRICQGHKEEQDGQPACAGPPKDGAASVSGLLADSQSFERMPSPEEQGQIVARNIMNDSYESPDAGKDYLNDIDNLMWYFYSLANHKDQGFKEGTYVIEDTGLKFHKFLLNSGQASQRPSSHYKNESMRFTHYGIDIENIPPKGKRHILFGQIAENQIFIKPENYGLGARDFLGHTGEFLWAQAVKAPVIGPWFGNDDGEDCRKERVPKEFKDRCTDILESNSATDKDILAKFKSRGIQELVAFLKEPWGNVNQQQVAQLQEYLDELTTEYQHLAMRSGQEVIFTQQELADALRA